MAQDFSALRAFMAVGAQHQFNRAASEARRKRKWGGVGPLIGGRHK
jgi:hypothetical protein